MTEHDPKSLRGFLDDTDTAIREAKRLYGQAKPWPWTTEDLRALMADKTGTLRMERDATLMLALSLPDLLERLERMHKIVDLEASVAEEAAEALDGE